MFRAKKVLGLTLMSDMMQCGSLKASVQSQRKHKNSPHRAKKTSVSSRLFSYQFPRGCSKKILPFPQAKVPGLNLIGWALGHAIALNQSLQSGEAITWLANPVPYTVPSLMPQGWVRAPRLAKKVGVGTGLAVLNGGWFWTPGDIWHYLETFLVAKTGQEEGTTGI